MAAACFLAFCFLLYTSMGDNSIVAVAVRNLRPDYLYLDNCGKCNDLRSSHYGSSSQSDLRPGRRQLWQLVSFERATWCRPLLPRSRLKKKKKLLEQVYNENPVQLTFSWSDNFQLKDARIKNKVQKTNQQPTFNNLFETFEAFIWVGALEMVFIITLFCCWYRLSCMVLGMCC